MGTTESRMDDCNEPRSKSPRYMEHTGNDGSQTRILIHNASNTQIGNNNLMIVGSGQRISKKSKKVRKRPITTSTAEPTQDQMDYIANNIGVLWRKLGRKLRLSDGQLDYLRMQYVSEGQYEVVYQMLRQWKSQYHPVTLHQLAEACDAVGRGDLSDYLS